jgi:NitT/TauT family transport system substrate-binding protein
MKLKTIYCWLIVIFCTTSFATEKTTIRLGILPFGTVNWELTALKNAGLAASEDFELEIRHVANPQAGKIALLSDAVDMIVSDWIWTAKQRSTGYDLTFYPFSNTAGALIVAANSPIRSVKDLNNKRLGIAGGELDKNWLLLRALLMQQYELDLDQSVEKVFAAPPLLNQQILQARVDAIITYWHYAARLEAQGYRQIINGKEILEGLGIKASIPSLGFVFNQSWANSNKKAVNSFLQATMQSKELLCTSDSAWEKIIPLTKAEDKKTQQVLRERYCAGRIDSWGKEQQQAADQIYSILQKLSHNRLTGSSEQLQPDIFWMIN